VTLISAASQVLSALRQENVKGCIVGGLAVSARCDPRFTRDVDIAVVVDTDEHAEALMHALATHGLQMAGLVEQEAVGRLAMVRLSTEDGLSVDLLIASSGIETEVVTNAEILEVVQGVLLPVARTGHLIALKLLSVAPGRETDAADLRNLAAVATQDEWNLASEAVAQIQDRGYARGRQLDTELFILRNPKL
jgi:predicted nucleotidyltransferase